MTTAESQAAKLHEDAHRINESKRNASDPPYRVLIRRHSGMIHRPRKSFD